MRGIIANEITRRIDSQNNRQAIGTSSNGGHCSVPVCPLDTVRMRMRGSRASNPHRVRSRDHYHVD